MARMSPALRTFGGPFRQGLAANNYGSFTATNVNDTRGQKKTKIVTISGNLLDTTILSSTSIACQISQFKF